MASFDLASILKDAGAQMGTGREQIEYIDIDKIDADANNFYAMSGISALMANIELIGLQQPIRVRPNPDAPGRYIVVSGHRRLTAFQQLRADKDGERWATIPAIVEACADSADLQELRLIYANADTRKISDFELRKQAERVEELLYKLKEQGVEFPGRMRDHVAEACKISKSKLGRLKQIKDGLAPDISLAYYETGKLPEATALALSRLPKDVQQEIIDRVRKIRRGNMSQTGAVLVKDMGQDIQRLRELNCRKCAGGGECINQARILDKLYSQGYRGFGYCGRGCCADCPDLVSCPESCARMKPKKDKLKADAKADRTAKKAAVEAQNSATIREIKRLWQRMDAACRAQGKDFLTICDACKLNGIRFSAPDYLAGDRIDSIVTPTPFGYRVDIVAINKLVAVADMLDVSLDYLLGRTDTMQPPAAELSEAAPQWQTGDPPEPGLYAVKVDGPAYSGVDITRYTGERWIGYGEGRQNRVVGWWPIPGEEGGDG